MSEPRTGRRLYAALGIFVSSLVVGAVSGGQPVAAAGDPPIEIVGISVPQTLSEVHDGVLFLDEDTAGNLYFGGGANLGPRVWRAAPSGDLEVFAGDGTFGTGGDGGPAVDAQLPGFGIKVVVGGDGAIYIQTSSSIRKINAAGIISTVAGNGTFGSPTGDGGPATAATLGSVQDMDVDSAGNIYLSAGSTLRKVTASTGIITTLAKPDNNTSNRNCNSLAGAVGSADIAGVGGVAVGSNGDLFVAVACPFATGARILRVNTSTNVASVFAGGGAGTEDAGGPATGVNLGQVPTRLKAGPAGQIAYQRSTNIRLITGAGVMTTPLTSIGAVQDFVVRSNIAFVLGTNFDNAGGLIVASGATRTYLTQGADPADGVDPALRQVSGLRGLAVDADGVVYYSTSTAPTVRALTTSDVLDTVLGIATSGPFDPITYGGDADASTWRAGTKLHVAANGDLFSVTFDSVGRVGSNGKLVQAYSTAGDKPTPLDVTTIGSTLYVSGRKYNSSTFMFEHTVNQVNAAGSIVDDFPFATPISDLAATSDAQVMIAPATGPALLKLDPGTGTTTPVAVPDGVQGKYSIAVDSAGTVFLADFRGLMMIPTSGSPSVVDDTPYAEVVIDNGGNVYVSRYGTITKFAGLGAGSVAGDAVVGDDTATTASGVPVTINVGANDSTTVGSLGPARVAQVPSNGTATVVSPTSIRYTSKAGFGGTDTFAYERCSTTAPLICGVGIVTVTVTGGGGGGGGGGASLITVVPARLYDTRPLPNETTDNEQQAQGRRAPGTVSEVQVAGRGGVDSDATAAVLNVTAIRPTRGGFATVYPCGADRPGASTLNYGPGDVVANNIVVKLGTGGKVCVYNLRDTDLVVDVTGFAPAGSSFGTVVPARVYDTRPLPNETTDNEQQAQGRRAAGQVTEVLIGGRGGVPANADAVAINTTVIRALAGGFATVYPCGEDRPGASTLNYAAGEVVANGAIVQLGVGGKICVYTLRNTDLVVDVTGFTPAGSDIVSVVPERLFDTRALPNVTVDGLQQEQGRRTAGQTSEVQITGRYGIPDGAGTAILNVTAIRTAAGGYATVYPCGEDRPGASTLNYKPGEVVANGTIVKIGTGGKVCVYGLRAMDLIVDVTGYIP